jgi:geranylgeranylglycerol-phosphate geranylgeranyltransferase
MAVSVVVPALKISRLPSCTVAFLTVLLPTYAHTHDPGRSLAASVPMFIICMCTFVLNDLNDIDRDRTNHPERPLPSGAISLRATAALFIMTFLGSIITIRLLTDPALHLLYLAILLFSLGYSPIADCLPKVKTFYVAAIILVGLILVAKTVKMEMDIRLLLTAFLFVLGREMLMDAQDAAGDGDTIAKWVAPKNATFLAFGLQALGVFILFSAVNAAREAIAASLIAVLLVAIVWGWRKEDRRRQLLQLMQVQMLSGIAFLL